MYVILIVHALVSFCHGHQVTSCDLSGPSPVTVSVSSRQNLTGHWISKVDLQYRKSLGKSASTVDVVHNALACSKQDEAVLNIGLLFTAPSHLQQQPDGYEHFPGVGYYKFHAKPANWTTARKVCSRENAHLVIINSQEEANAIIALFNSHPKIPGASDETYAWMGVYRVGEDYYTVKGESLEETGFVHWGPGQPHRGQEDCILTTRATAELADYLCHWTVAFICELVTTD